MFSSTRSCPRRLSHSPVSATWQFGEIKVIFFIPVTPTTQASLLDLTVYVALHQFLAPRLQELLQRIGQLQVRKPTYVCLRKRAGARDAAPTPR